MKKLRNIEKILKLTKSVIWSAPSISIIPKMTEGSKKFVWNQNWKHASKEASIAIESVMSFSYSSNFGCHFPFSSIYLLSFPITALYIQGVRIHFFSNWEVGVIHSFFGVDLNPFHFNVHLATLFIFDFGNPPRKLFNFEWQIFWTAILASMRLIFHCRIKQKHKYQHKKNAIFNWIFLKTLKLVFLTESGVEWWIHSFLNQKGVQEWISLLFSKGVRVAVGFHSKIKGVTNTLHTYYVMSKSMLNTKRTKFSEVLLH